ncbi:MAG: hypothetical protein WB797_12265 [Nocardioides sp.]
MFPKSSAAASSDPRKGLRTALTARSIESRKLGIVGRFATELLGPAPVGTLHVSVARSAQALLVQRR